MAHWAWVWAEFDKSNKKCSSSGLARLGSCYHFLNLSLLSIVSLQQFSPFYCFGANKSKTHQLFPHNLLKNRTFFLPEYKSTISYIIMFISLDIFFFHSEALSVKDVVHLYTSWHKLIISWWLFQAWVMVQYFEYHCTR